jgi:hypothetical protein
VNRDSLLSERTLRLGYVLIFRVVGQEAVPRRERKGELYQLVSGWSLFRLVGTTYLEILAVQSFYTPDGA